MKKLYLFETFSGTFYISRTDRNYFTTLGKLILGSYSTPEEAAKDLSNGTAVPVHLKAENLSTLRISDDLSKWVRLY